MITLANSPSNAQSFAGDVVTIDGFGEEKFVIETAKQVNYKLGPNAGLTGWWITAVGVVESNGALTLDGTRLGFVQSGLFDADDFKTDSARTVSVIGRWTEIEVSSYDALTEEERDTIEQAMSDEFDRTNMSDTILPTDMITEMARAAIEAYVKMRNA